MFYTPNTANVEWVLGSSPIFENGEQIFGSGGTYWLMRVADLLWLIVVLGWLTLNGEGKQ